MSVKLTNELPGPHTDLSGCSVNICQENAGAVGAGGGGGGMSQGWVLKHIGLWGVGTEVLHAGGECYITKVLVSLALRSLHCSLRTVEAIGGSAVWKKMHLRRVCQDGLGSYIQARGDIGRTW